MTWCGGSDGCNGYGVLAAGGRRKYRVRGQGKNISPNAVPHEKCKGWGLAVCGCVPVDAATLDMLSRPPVRVAVPA